jgi:hypothetical protein
MSSIKFKLDGSIPLSGIDIKFGLGYNSSNDLEVAFACASKNENGFGLADLVDQVDKLNFIDNLFSYYMHIKEISLNYNYNKRSYKLMINGQENNIADIDDRFDRFSHKSAGFNDNGAKDDIFELPAMKIPVKKKIGPINIYNIGLKLDIRNTMVWIPLDAAISMSCMDFGLNGFSLGIPFKKAFKKDDIKCELSGLNLAFIKDPIEISGGFLKAKGSFDGEALIKIKNFSISALGSYSPEPSPSLFIFALASYPIGGPPCFYVTGLAAGFGYNRTLKIPEVDQLAKFPLVSCAISDNRTYKPTLDHISGELEQYIPPSTGDFWMAAGVKFTSFNMIYSIALLTVNFGTKLEVALLGRSILDVPSGGNANFGSLKAAHAELLIKVKFDPENGVVAATGKLAPNSYILSKDCNLSGGFAFYTWFDGDNRGDFVLSLGGYHPEFKPPGHYPIVDRLALNWPISQSLSIKGSGYFALTPSCIMAGGALDAVYQEGNLKAWFTAHADFLMEWKPFHYDINVGVTIGASYRVDNFFVHKTFTIELGAEAHLWGPEFSGEVTIKWLLLSYTIKFVGRSVNETLDWDSFKESFLPKSPCNVTISRGLLKEENDAWIVNPLDFSFIIRSTIPCTSINLVDESSPDKIYIRPMRKEACSPIYISIYKDIFNKNSININNKFCCSSMLKEKLPTALWGPQESISLNADMLSEVLVGLQLDLNNSDNSKTSTKKKINIEKLCQYKIKWTKMPTTNPEGRINPKDIKKTSGPQSCVLISLNKLFNIDMAIDLKELLKEPRAALSVMPISIPV